MKPAPYPPNTTEEIEAIVTFEGLLDKRFVVPHLSRLDKVPNTDGHIEIVDEERHPVGRLEVQVRKIPDGAISYSCPAKLIAYSQTISLPFLLVCVDVGNRKAYFRLLDRSMPEFNPDQPRFTVRFDPKVSSVEAETQYLRQWREIIDDYNRRVADYPRLHEIGKRVDLSHISRADRIYFQRFIDRVNRLLDFDLPVVKERFFRGVWKLGVGVASADPSQVGFQLYTISEGDASILVSAIPQPSTKPSFVPEGRRVVSFWLEGGWQNGSAVQYHWRDRSVLKGPQEEADDFVFSYLTRLIRGMGLPLYGKRLSIEYLFWFVDRFGQSLGVRPSERLSVADLNFGAYVYLPAWASVAVPRYVGEVIRLNKSRMDQLSPEVILAPPFELIAGGVPESLGITKEEVVRMIRSGKNLAPARVSFAEASPQLLVQAVDFLTSINEEWIERPYRPRAQRPGWVWQGYDPDSLRHNMRCVLVDSVDEYQLFVERNQIPRRKMVIRDRIEAIIHVANFVDWASAKDFASAPVLSTYRVKNEDGRLPKVTLVDSSQTPAAVVVDKGRLKLNGLERETISSYPSHPTDLFKDLPMLNRVYAMIREDLQNEFKHNFS